MTWLRGRVVLVLVLVLDAGARRVVLVGHRLVAQPACRRYAATDRQLRPPIVARLAPRRDDAGEWLAGSHWLVGFRLVGDQGGGVVGGGMPGTGAAWKYAYYPLPLPVANFSAKVIHMGKGLGWATLDSLIEHLGEDGVLRMFCTRISEGESPLDIARSNGVPWYAFRGWLEDSTDRMNAWDLADRCFADGLAYEREKLTRIELHQAGALRVRGHECGVRDACVERRGGARRPGDDEIDEAGHFSNSHEIHLDHHGLRRRGRGV